MTEKPTSQTELMGIKVVLLDFEGTFVPLSFVTDRLFPYAKERIEEMAVTCKEMSREVAVAEMAKALPVSADAISQMLNAYMDAKSRELASDSSVSDILNHMATLDGAKDKTSSFKDLQGWLWNGGYETGELIGKIYPEVPAKFKKWKDDDIAMVGFSSGSAEAQERLVTHSDKGNLSGFFGLEGCPSFFDPSMALKGVELTVEEQQKKAKHLPKAYAQISKMLGIEPSGILFLTDDIEEAKAAKSAGMRATLICREGPFPPDADMPVGMSVVQNFDELPKLTKAAAPAVTAQAPGGASVSTPNP